MSLLRIKNRDARRLWLSTNGLASTPTGPLNLMEIITRLGFVQIDTIRNVTRAHHHILWSRNQNYREKLLWPTLRNNRALFEHFTHDASLIPMAFYPMWQRQFRRLGEKVARHYWYQPGLAKTAIRDIRARIEREGPLSTRAFESKIDGPREMWARPPHKKALDQMWYAGDLTTSHRENFIKFYDLADRVIPNRYRADQHSDQAQIDWLCTAALDRLSFASPGEIQRFWAATDAAEVKRWISQQQNLQQVEIETHEGEIVPALAPEDFEARIANLGPSTSRLRILNPFDPAIRDRNRLLRLFGFHYRNEMFVPKEKRIWGYYVYPLLEGDRFVGRLEIRVDKGANVTGFWPEPGITWSARRREKLMMELARFARLAGIGSIGWACDLPA